MKTWHIVDSIFTTQSLVQHQIDSFNNFVRFGIQKVVDEFKTLQIKECTITFENISISPVLFTESDGDSSLLFPHEARLRNLSYLSSLYVDISLSDNGNTQS